MAKIIPSFQTQVDTRDGGQVQVHLTKAVMLGNASDYVALGRTEDARILLGRGQTLPTFYLSGSTINFENATAGVEYLIASRHRGSVNRNPGS
jgi:hypothetical protein